MHLRFSAPRARSLRASFLQLGLLGLALATGPGLRAEYRVVARYPVPDQDGHFDYVRVDAASRRLFIAHGDRFDVLDADNGSRLGTIAPVSWAHGVALVPATGHGFATSGGDGQIIMFDLKTLAPLRRVASTGRSPDAIEYDAGTNRVYVANHGSGDVTVLDPASGDVVGTVRFGGGALEGLAFDGRGRGFVNIEDKSAIGVFDLKTLQPLATWPVAPVEGGTGLAIDAPHHRLFSAGANNRLAVVDSDTGRIVATPAIGDDPDGVVFEPATGRAFVSNVDGTLTIVAETTPDRFAVLQTVVTRRGCRTIALDEKTGRVVTCAPEYGPLPAAGANGAHRRPPAIPGTFEAIVVGTK